MRIGRRFVLLALSCAAAACGSVPNETTPPPGGRLVAPAGVIRGSVVYNGPHPCSSKGHIVGNALVLVFKSDNPPPPGGTASTAINFGVVIGDVLFGGEPRNPGSDSYCPADHGIKDTITVSAPFVIGPLDGGSYILESFFDYTGDFLPSFKFRNLPELGDIAGGDLDTADALKPVNAGNPNFQPHFFPVEVGIRQPLGADAGVGMTPTFTIPANGFVADNVTVTMGLRIATPRPYFYAQGLAVNFDTTAPNNQNISTQVTQSSEQPLTSADGLGPTATSRGTQETSTDYAPILVIPQDIQVLAAPSANSQDTPSVNHFEASLPHLRLEGGVPMAELDTATSAKQPFHFQIPLTPPGGTFLVWQKAAFDPAKQLWTPLEIPEGQGLPDLWPFVALTKLVDDPTHKRDPASITSQGSPTEPTVVLQAITLFSESPRPVTGGDPLQAGPESIVSTGFAEAGGGGIDIFDKKTGRPTVFVQDHVTVLIRPAAICFDTLFDSKPTDKRGTLVTPHFLGTSADLPTGQPGSPIVSPSLLSNPALASLIRPNPVQGCLPTGRYAINVVYPNGQAWTVPNEAGACSGTEGLTNYKVQPPTCTLERRAVLRSQGVRAVVEIVAAKDPTYCKTQAPTPAVCLPRP